MGYDLYVCDNDGEIIRPADPENSWTSEYYWRESIWTISDLRQFLLENGMAFSVEDYSDFITPNGWCGQDGTGPFAGPVYPGEDATPEEQAEYEKAECEWLRAHGPEVPGIPIHKFVDNSGWWVLPYECEAALKIWEQKGKPVYNTDDETAELITFLRSAARRGGFRTY